MEEEGTALGKLQFHDAGFPPDKSVNTVALLKQTVVVLNAAAGIGLTVIICVIVSAHPLPLATMSVTE